MRTVKTVGLSAPYQFGTRFTSSNDCPPAVKDCISQLNCLLRLMGRLTRDAVTAWSSRRSRDTLSSSFRLSGAISRLFSHPASMQLASPLHQFARIWNRLRSGESKCQVPTNRV